MRPSRRLVAAAPALLATAAGPAVPPRRIVSLSPCLDAILVEVADRGAIAALSHYSRDPQSSTIADVARSFPQTYESAEEVLVLRPDLVLASLHAARPTLAALARMGVRVEAFAVPDTIAASLEQVARIGRLVAHPERARALAARIAAAVAAAAPPPGARPVDALVFEPRGLVAGSGTLVSELMARAGLVNVAARYGVRQWGSVPLERLVADPPRLLLSAQAAPGAPTWGERVVSHPALRAVAGRMRRAAFPERLLYCGGPALIPAAQALTGARRIATAGA